MSLSTPEIGKARAETDTDNNAAEQTKVSRVSIKTDVFLALLVFALVFGLCWWQNPSSIEPRTTLYFDGGHYLDSCKQISAAIHDWAGGVASKTTAESVAYYLLLDGPVLPLAGALAFALQAKVPNPADWFVLVQMQCLLQAFAATTVYYLTRALTGRPKAGLVGGLMWGAYPATIASCGMFLTEPLACALVLLAVACLYRFVVRDCQFGVAGSSGKVLTGSVLGALGLLKTALIPALGLITVLSMLCAHSRKKAIGALVLVGVGAAVALAPWMAFTQYATGQMTLFPSRKPVYNIATGMNIESDGWGCYPTHPVTAMFSDEESGLSVVVGMYSAHPSEISNLFLRKVTRFWTYPWNDFRYRICGLNFKIQTLVQSLLIMLGLCGAAFYGAFAIARRGIDRSQLFVAFSAIGIIFGHLIYLPFEGIARYGFTAMPFFVMLAASVLALVFHKKTAAIAIAWLATLVATAALLQFDLLPYTVALLGSTDSGMALEFALRFALVTGTVCFSTFVLQKCLTPKQARCKTVLATLAAIFSLVFALILFAFEYSERESKQWQSPLKQGMSVTRNVDLSRASRPDWALVLVDGDAEIAHAQVAVNGTVIKQPLESLYQYYGRKYDLQNYMGMFASLQRQSPDKLRQWRAVQIDPDLLDFRSRDNELKVTAMTAKGTIFGDFVRDGARELLLPSFEQISPGKLFNSAEDNYDCRMMQKVGAAPLVEKCLVWTGDQRKNGEDLSPKPGVQQGRFRVFLLAGYDQRHLKGASAIVPVEPSTATVDIPVVSAMFAAGGRPGIVDGSGLELKRPAFPYRAQVIIPTSVLGHSHVRIEIGGTARSSGEAGNLAIAGVLKTGDKQDLAAILPGCPALFKVDGAVHPFHLQADVPSGSLRGTTPTVVVELSSTASPIVCDKLNLRLRSIQKADFDGHAIKFF